MHDLHEANKILKLVLEYAENNKLNRVTKAVIALGKVEEHGSEILPDNLIFNIQLLAKGTLAENIKIKIKHSKEQPWVLEEIVGD